MQGTTNQITLQFITKYDEIFREEGEISPYSAKYKPVRLPFLSYLSWSLRARADGWAWEPCSVSLELDFLKTVPFACAPNMKPFTLWSNFEFYAVDMRPIPVIIFVGVSFGELF